MHQFSTRIQAKKALKESKPFKDSILFLRALSFFIEKQTGLNRSANLLFIPLCDVAERLFHLLLHTFRDENSYAFSKPNILHSGDDRKVMTYLLDL